MNHIFKTKLAYALTTAVLATGAHAEGFDRNVPDNLFMFEPGGYVELGSAFLKPDITGSFATPGESIPTGNISDNFAIPQFAIKTDINDRFSLGLRYSQPYGLTAQYPDNTPPLSPPFARGTGGEFGANELALFGRYKLNDRHSVFGSLRLQEYSGYLRRGGVQFDFESSYELGYSLGYAFEIPEQRLLFSAEYRSAVEHSNTTVPRNSGIAAIADPTSPLGITLIPVTAGEAMAQDTIHRTPQSLTLTFLTKLPIGDGRNQMFARYRWAEWSEADITFNGLNPTQFVNSQIFGLGFGRLVTDNLAVTVVAEYRTGGESPKPGLTPFEDSYGLLFGMRYALNDDTVLQVGYSKIWFEDATTANGGTFENNSADGVFLKIGYYF